MIAMRVYRTSHWLQMHRVPLLPWLLKSFCRIVFAVVLHPTAKIGRGVVLSYEGLGTVIHRRAAIGDNAIIGTGVSIGGRSVSIGVPTIGDGAFISGGAKILGDIRVGSHASIGANAVVLQDIPDYAVAVGVPARIVRIGKPGDMPDYHTF